MYYKTAYLSPVGMLILGSDGENLVGLWREGQKYFGDSVPEEMIENNDLPVFAATKEWLDRYFAGEEPEIKALPLSPIGSEFRQMVWKLLMEIPYGKVTTYGEIAHKIAALKGGKAMSAQAVGGAVGHNPVSIIIPCHRVVGSNGSLTGFAGGLEMKMHLLEHEGVDVTAFMAPKNGSAL